MRRISLIVVLAAVIAGAVGGVPVVHAAPGLYPAPNRSLSVYATDLVASPDGTLVYAAVPAQAPRYPSSVVAIDVATWTVVASVAGDGAPTRLAISDDGSMLYLGARSAQAVRQYALPGLSLVRSFAISPSWTGDIPYPIDFAVMPGDPDVVAVSAGDRTKSPAFLYVELYDRGVRRPNGFDGYSTEQIEFGDDPEVLYGFWGAELTRLRVGPSGLTPIDSTFGLNPGGEIVSSGGLFFGRTGAVDPITMSSTASYNAMDRTVSPEPAANRVWSIGYTGQQLALEAYGLPDGALVDQFGFPDGGPGPLPLSVDRMISLGDGSLVLSLHNAFADPVTYGALRLLRPSAIRGSGGEYTPLTPSRLLDTRDGTGRGGVTTPISAGQSIDVQITGGHGIPSLGVDAVVLNATVTEPTASGFITIWPTGSARPTISNLNFTPGLTVPNLVTVAVGDGGRLSVFNSSGFSHLIFDIAGYYSAADGPTGARFHPVTPKRLFDTRTGEGGVRPALGAGETLQFDVRGKQGLPATGMVGIALNVTAADPTRSGYLTVSPADTARPVVSNLNFTAGQIVPNLVIVRVPASGLIDFFNFAGTTDLIADVVGYYDLDRSSERGRFVSYEPYRLIDTREFSPFDGDGRLEPDSILIFGYDDEPASAYVMNVTVTGSSTPGFLAVYPYQRSLGYDNPIPDSSNLNFVANQTVPNLVMVKTGGSIGVYNPFGYTHVVVDFFGEFT